MSDIVKMVRDAGVVGAGGAGFPTDIKLAALCDAGIDTIIINGAECEPLLYVDQSLMAAFAGELTETLQLLLAKSGAVRGVFALKKKYLSAAAALGAAISGVSNVELLTLGNYYPVGDEHVLVYEVTKRVIQPGGIPPQAGVLILNVETLYNIWQALHKIPVCTKFVTVAGEVKRPGTYCLPVGAPYKVLLDRAQPAIADYVLVEGGPIMGAIVENSGFISKTTKGLLVLPPDHPVVAHKRPGNPGRYRLSNGCCQCRECTDFCPRYLLGHDLTPHKSLRVYVKGDISLLHNALLCTDCGLCDYYVCPSGLSPRLIHKMVKEQFRNAGYARPAAPAAREVPSYRKWRQIPVSRITERLRLEHYASADRFYIEPLTAEYAQIPRERGGQ